MRNRNIFCALVIVVLVACNAAAQNPGDKAAQNRVLGEVTAINSAQMQIDLRAKAAVISLGDISVGDKVIARGERGEGEGALRAGALIVVSKAEMAKKLE